MDMGSSLPEQHFTFASPVSEAYEDALDFDYKSWIEQSKSSYSSSQDDKWMDAEAIRRHYREMVIRAAEDLPEEAYELSLRDLAELPKATNEGNGCGVKKRRLGSIRNSMPWRKTRSRNETMEGAGIIVKMFMPSLSGASGRKKKRFSGSTSAAMQKTSESGDKDGYGSMKTTAAETENESDNTRSNSMPSEGHQHSLNNRKSIGCFPFFNSSNEKRKLKLITSSHVSLKETEG